MTADRATMVFVAAVVAFLALPLVVGSSARVALPATILGGAALGLAASIWIRSLRHRIR